jgi:hypothetical protein
MRGSKKGVDTDRDGIPDSFGEDDLGRIPTQAAQDSGIDPIIQSEAEYQSAADNFKNTSDSFLFSTILARNPKNQQMIDGFVKAGKTVEEARSLMLDNAAKKAGMDPVEYRASLSKSAIREFNKLTPSQQAENKIFASDYRNYVDAKSNFEFESALKKEDDEILSNVIGEAGMKTLATGKIKPIKTTFRGKPIELSAEDQYDLAMYANAKKTYFGFTLDPAVRQAGKDAEQRLKDKGKGFILDNILDYTGVTKGYDIPTLAGRGIVGSMSMLKKDIGSLFTDTESDNKFFVKIAPEISKIAKNIDDEVLAKARAAKVELVNKRHNIRPNLDMEVFTGDTKTNTALLAKLKSIVGSNTVREANLSADMDKLSEKLMSAKTAADLEGGLTFKFTPKAGSTVPNVEIVLTDVSGRVGGVTVTPEQANSLGVDIASMYESEDTKKARTLMQTRGGKTSNGDFANAEEVFNNNDVLFNKQNFINLTGYTNKDIKANIVTSNDGLHYGIFYIKDGANPVRKKEVGPFKDLGQLVNAMKLTTPNVVDSAQ